MFQHLHSRWGPLIAEAHAQALLPCRARAGLCMSQDGKNWARLEAEHHTAAVIDAGDEGDWDEAFIGSPQVHSNITWKLATSSLCSRLNSEHAKARDRSMSPDLGGHLSDDTVKPTVRLSLFCMQRGLQAESSCCHFSS